MTKVKEYQSFAEIGAFLHRNDGEAYVQTYTSVNEPIKIEGSKDAEMITKVRVNIDVEEDRGVQRRNGGGFYAKRVEASQVRDDNTVSTARTTPGAPMAAPKTAPSDGMDKTDYLKNMHDQLDNRETANKLQNQNEHTVFWLVILGVAIIATTALVLWMV